MYILELIKELRSFLSWVNDDRGMDSNGDGKLDFTEFVKHTYDTYRIYMEFETLGAQIPTAEEKFADLDTNNDE